MHQSGLFDVQMRVDEVNDCGNPLLKLNEFVDWEVFRPQLKTFYQKERKSNADRKPYDVVLLRPGKVLDAFNLNFIMKIEFSWRLPIEYYSGCR